MKKTTFSSIVKITIATALVIGSGIGIYFIVDAFTKDEVVDETVAIAPEVTIENLEVNHESSANNQKGLLEFDINVNNKTPDLTTYELENLTLTEQNNLVPVEEYQSVLGNNTIGELSAGTYDLELGYSYTMNDTTEQVNQIIEEDIIINDYDNVKPNFTFGTIQTTNANYDVATGGMEIKYTYEDTSTSLVGTDIEIDIIGPTNYSHSFTPIEGTNELISITDKFLAGDYTLAASYEWDPGIGFDNKQEIVTNETTITVSENQKITIIPNEFKDDNFYDNLIFDFDSIAVPMLGHTNKTNGIHIHNQYIDIYFDYNDLGPSGGDIKIFPPNTLYPSTNAYLDFADSTDQQTFINDFTNFMIYFQDNVYTTHQIMTLEGIVFTNRNASHMWGNDTIFFYWEYLYGGFGVPRYEDGIDDVHTTIGENPEIAHQIIAHEYGHHETLGTMSSAQAFTGGNWKNSYPWEKFDKYLEVSKWNQIPKMAEYQSFSQDESSSQPAGSYLFKSNPDVVSQSDYFNYEGFPDMVIPSYDGSINKTFTHGVTNNPTDFSYLMSYHERLARDLTVLQVDINFDNYPAWNTILHHWDVQMIEAFFPSGWIEDNQTALDTYYDTMLKYAYADTNLGKFGDRELYIDTNGDYDIQDRSILGVTDVEDEYSYLVFENEDEIIKSEIKYYQPIHYLDANRTREQLGYKWTATLPLDEIDYNDEIYDVYFEDASGSKIENFTYSDMTNFEVKNYLDINIDQGTWNKGTQLLFENNNGNIEATFRSTQKCLKNS